MCATSTLVHTACTPDNSSAAPASIDLIFPCAAGERTTRIIHWPGNEMSAAKRPWPKIRGRSSRRSTERPTNFCTASIIMAIVAYLGQTFICLVLVLERVQSLSIANFVRGRAGTSLNSCDGGTARTGARWLLGALARFDCL